MKRLISTFLLVTLIITSTPVMAGGGSSPAGLDPFRGSWGGTMQTSLGDNLQLNLYFNNAVAINDTTYKASGYSSITWEQPDKPKRAKAPFLPMMAKYTQIDSGTYSITILTSFTNPPVAPPGTHLRKFVGVAKFSGSGISDDTLAGQWYAKAPDGSIRSASWEAGHLDRRNVGAPEVSLLDPTLYYRVDVTCGLAAPYNPDINQRNPRTLLMVNSNIVLDSVKVTYPDGSSRNLPPYTDPFSPNVDWVTEFRFGMNHTGLPIAGGAYIFTALDVSGNPIPGVVNTDVWTGPPAVPPPVPPINTFASPVNSPKPGIFTTWPAVPAIPGSFEPPNVGFYQIEIYNSAHVMVYGAGRIGGTPPSHLVPQNRADFVANVDWGSALGELVDGAYQLEILILSVAPAGSAGKGFEYNVRAPAELWRFNIVSGTVTNLRKGQ